MPELSPFVAAAAVPADSVAATSVDIEGATADVKRMQPCEEVLSFSIIETAELQQLTQQLADVSAACRKHEVEAAVKDAQIASLHKLTTILQSLVEDLCEDREMLDHIMARMKPVAIQRLQGRLQEEAASELTCSHTRQLLVEADELLEELAQKQKGIGVFQLQLDDLRMRYRWAVNTINERNAAATAPGETVHSWPVCNVKMPGSCCEYAKQLDRKLRVKHQHPEWHLAALEKEYATAQQQHAAAKKELVDSKTAVQEAKTAGVLQVSALFASGRYQGVVGMYKRAVARRELEQRTMEACSSGLRGFAAAGITGGDSLPQFGKTLPDSHFRRSMLSAMTELASSSASLIEPIVAAKLQEESAAAQLMVAQLKLELVNVKAELRAWQAGQPVEHGSDTADQICAE